MNSSDTYRQALSCAVKHIGIATYSSGKIFIYLVNKGFPEDIASGVVKELIERQYIDDHKASRKVIISRTGKKQESRDYIYKRLLAAGIDEGVADEVTASLPSDNETCLMLYESLDYDEDSEEVRASMIDMAIKRGFTYDTASEAYRTWSDNIT